MTDLSQLPHQLRADQATCRAIVETPGGHRSKFAYDPDSGLFELGGLLPEGMAFPYDFGFVPATRAEDGDPLDVLVLSDEPTFPGCLVEVRLIGVLEAEQTEEGHTERNDRLLAVSVKSFRYRDIRTLDGLPATVTEQLEQFFVNYNAVKGKTFTVLARRGPAAAVKRIEQQAVATESGGPSS